MLVAMHVLRAIAVSCSRDDDRRPLRSILLARRRSCSFDRGRVRRERRAAPFDVTGADSRRRTRGVTGAPGNHDARWPSPTPACAGCAAPRVAARPRARDAARRRATSSCRCSSTPASTAASRSRRCPASTRLLDRAAPSRRPARPRRSASPACCCSASRPTRTRRARAPGTTRASSSSRRARSRTPHPDLLVITDLCLCEYTSHGHCGVAARRRQRRQRRVARAARPHRGQPRARGRRHRSRRAT